MIYILLYISEVVILLLFEKRLWGTLLTPVNMLSLPCTIVILIAIAYSYSSDTIPDFYLPSLTVWGLGLMLFAIPSVILSKLSKKRRFSYKVIGNDDAYKIIYTIGVICIFFSLVRVLNIVGAGLSFGNEEFINEYETSGILAHMNVLMSVIFSYMIFKSDSNHKFSYLIIVLSLIGMYAVGVKSWIIAPFLIGYYARLITNRTVFTIKSVILPILASVGFFLFSYYLIMIISGDVELTSGWTDFIINHFLLYLIGGPLSFSLDYQQGILEPIMQESLIGPLIDIFKAIFGGEYTEKINPVFLSIGELGETNVRTFLGTIWAYAQDGMIFIVVVISLSFYIHIVFALSKRSNNIFIILAHCSNLVLLSFGFFEFYWLNLSAYEMPAILLMLSTLPKIKLSLRPPMQNSTKSQ